MEKTTGEKRIINPIASPYLLVLALIVGLGIGLVASSIFKPPVQIATISDGTTQNTSADITDLNTSYFNQVYKLFKDNYIGQIPSSTDLTYGAIKGVISSVGNQYNSFLTPTEANDYLNARDPNIEGIGVTLKYDGSYTEIESVLNGYPAEKAGLRNGDVILEVDGEKMGGVLPNVVSTKVKGASGTSVKLKVARKVDDNEQSFDFEIVRQKINIDNISFDDLGNGIYKINIVQFLDKSTDDFNNLWDSVVAKVLAKGTPKGIIVELRNNPGGYVFSVRHVLEEFLPKNKVMMYEQLKNDQPKAYSVTRDGKLVDVPMVVLVNEGSASAAEIFSAGIQDNGRGKIVGKQTVGKGVEQQVMTLNDNSLLIVVFQKWLTPNSRNISKTDPIHPDFEINFSEDDLKKGLDPQLQKAKELLGL